MKHREPFDDDGRTVADMSGLDRESAWLPRRPKSAAPPAEAAPRRPWEDEPGLTRRELFWAILGAWKATLLVAAVYLLGLLALIGLLLLLWR